MFLIDTILQFSVRWDFWVLFQALGHISDDLLVSLPSEVVVVDQRLGIICMQDRHGLVIAGVGSLCRGHVQLGETLLQVDVEVLECRRIFFSRIALSRVWRQESGVVLVLRRVRVLKAGLLRDHAPTLLLRANQLVLRKAGGQVLD